MHDLILQIQDALESYRKRFDRPFVMEVTGTPNSGKTYAIRAFETQLSRMAKSPSCRGKTSRVKVIYEAAQQCIIKNKRSPLFDTWTISQTIQSLVEALSDNYDLIICERGLLDALCWFTLHYQEKQITGSEFNATMQYILQDRFARWIGCVCIMTCSVETSMCRERLEDKGFLPGSIVNRDMLTKYNCAQESVRKMCESHFRHITVFCTSELNRSQITSRLQKILLDCLKRELI